MTRTFAAYLAAALASMSGLSAGATAKPILETSEQAFSPVLTCNGKVGAGGAFPKITAALDASQEITVSMWVCVDKFPSADDTGPTKMLGLFSRGWGLRCTLDRTLGVQLTYPGENGGKDRYAYCQWAVPPNGLRKGDWNHFAFTCSATNAALYVNGEIKASSRTIAGSRIACRGETFRLGTLPGYAPMNGKIGRARVWDRALRLDEIIASERDAARELAANFGEKTDDMAEAAKSRIRYRLDAADRALAAGKPLYWGIVDPMGPATFSHDSDIEPDAINKPLLVCAAKSEYEAASFVVRPMEDIKGFVPTVSGFMTKSGATLPPSIVDVRFVKEAVVAGGNRFIRVRRGEYLLHDDALLKCDFEKMQSFIRLDTPTGTVYRCVTEPMDSNRFEKYMSAEEWPIHDADTMQPLALTKREGVQYWLTFHVPADAKAGLYTGSVHLTAKGRRVASIPVKLRVLPFELPEPRTGYDVTKKFRPGVYYRHNWHNLSDPKACGSITSCGRNERQFRAELRSLKAHNIQLIASTITDTTDYGIYRILCSEPDKAYKILKDAGVAISLSEVFAIELDDVPGKAADAIDFLAKEDISISYLYSFLLKGKGVLIFRTDNTEKAQEAIDRNGLKVIEEKDISKLL